MGLGIIIEIGLVSGLELLDDEWVGILVVMNRPMVIGWLFSLVSFSLCLVVL